MRLQTNQTGAVAPRAPRLLLVGEIVDRILPGALRTVSPADFKVAAWQPLESKEGFGTLVPYCVDLQSRRSLYVRVSDVDAVRTAKFQYMALRACATAVLSVPWEFGSLAKRTIPSPVLVFSVGRCGSTLLVEAMRSSGALCLSEPDFFTQAVAARHHPVGVSEEQLGAVVSALAADLIASCSAGFAGSALVKLRSECCRDPALLLRDYVVRRPTTLFILRDFQSWARSMLRATVLPPEAIVGRYLQYLNCLIWLLRHTECHWLRYEDLSRDPVSTVAAAAKSAGLPLQRAELSQVIASDAQAGTPLSREMLAKREVSAAALSRALVLWTHTKPRLLLRDFGLPDL